MTSLLSISIMEMVAKNVSLFSLKYIVYRYGHTVNSSVVTSPAVSQATRDACNIEKGYDCALCDWSIKIKHVVRSLFCCQNVSFFYHRPDFI